MADTVQLFVNLNQGDVLARLTEIDAKLSSIQGKSKIAINIGTSQLTRAANQSAVLAKNVNQLQQAGVAVGNAAQQSGQQATKALNQTAVAAQNAQKSTSFLGTAFANIGKMAFWQISGKIVSSVFKAFDDGIQTMKDVDTELVNIRKVTGWSQQQLDDLTRSAYSTASAYGRTATEVLSASTVFARAGYGEQISQLSELSVLLQNVGQLTDDQAATFIIAADKAYKLGGSYEDLMTVIDGLDNITNRNATDMQKMTEGMTVAGSIFAESGESIEMFAALLGTATADTQRSGSEMARGLRTILMNLRQIRGETEDGELIGGESWAQASKALKEYANISTMENGQLRKASDVLRDLAGVWKDLDSVQQSAIAEAVAGKRQANVLSVLMGDWESVEKMLEEYINGAGTALAENEIYLDSWQAKSAQISATWSEIMNRLIGSDTVKGAQDKWLNVLTAVADFLAPAIEKASEATKAYETELEAVRAERDKLIEQGDTLSEQEKQRLTYLKQREKYLEREAEQSRQNEFDSWQKETGRGYNTTTGAFRNQDLVQLQSFQQAVQDANQGFLSGRLTAEQYANAIGDVVAQTGPYVEAAKQWQAEGFELTETQKNLVSGYNALTSALGKAEEGLDFTNFKLGRANPATQLYTDAVDALTLAEGKEVEQADSALASMAKRKQAAHDLAEAQEEAYRTELEYQYGLQDAAKTAEKLSMSLRAVAEEYETAQEYMVPDDLTQTGAELQWIVEKYRGYAESLKEIQNAGAQLTPTQEKILSAFDKLDAAVASGAQGADAYAAVQSAVEDLTEAIEEVPADTKANIQTNAAAETGKVNALQSAIDSLHGKTITVTVNTEGFPHLSGEFASGTDSAPGGPTLVNEEGPELIAARGLAWIAGGGKPTVTYVPAGATVYTAQETQELFNRDGQPSKPMRAFASGTEDLSGSQGDDTILPGSGGSSGSRRAKPNFKKLEKDLADVLKNLDLQAELAENEGDLTRAMGVYLEAQQKIAELVEQYRAAGYAEDSTEILTLLNKGYDYAGKQNSAYDDIRDNLISALEDLTRATDDANELAERREAVEKARKTLANAQRQRTIRVYNPVTGQWEWVANAEDIQKAQESLKSAEEALRKEEISQAIDALENADKIDFENVPIAQALLDLIAAAPGETQSEILRLFGAASGATRDILDESAATPYNQGPTTNIGTQYTFGDLTLTEEQAASMTVRELAERLRLLNIME